MVPVLHYQIGNHGKYQHGKDNVELDGEADEVTVCKCYDKPQ